MNTISSITATIACYDMTAKEGDILIIIFPHDTANLFQHNPVPDISQVIGFNSSQIRTSLYKFLH